MISREELNRLIGYSGRHMLSITMPVDRPGAEMQQNPIRLKNLIDEAEQKLSQQGMAPGDISGFLKPINDLLSSMVFWQEQNEGLAIFRSDEEFITQQAPIRFEARVYLNTNFYTRPLVELLESGEYYVLALSLNKTRLYKATRYDIQEIDLGEAPAGVENVTQYEEYENQYQFHTEKHARPAADRNAMFFAQGGSQGSSSNEVNKKDEIRRFFQILDRQITPQISHTSYPMVLIGLDHLQPIYREVNHYPHVYKETIQTNPDGMSARQLHEQSWKLVKPFFLQARQAAVDGYHIFAKQKQASKDIEQIVPASFVGQVETLLITRDIHIWGRFDAHKLSVEVYPRRQGTENEDLVDTAVANTLRTGGMIYCYDPVDMPDGAQVAAVLRYPLDGIDYKSNKEP